MQASVEVAGTRIVTTRCTLIVNQRFCARVRMANVPLDWFTYRFSGDWKSLEKDVQKHAVEGQCHFFFCGMWWALSPVIATSPDSMVAPDLRCLRSRWSIPLETYTRTGNWGMAAFVFT